MRGVAGTEGGRLTGARLIAARGVTGDGGDACAPATEVRATGRESLTGAGRVGRPATSRAAAGGVGVSIGRPAGGADGARGADGADMADGADAADRGDAERAEGRAEGACGVATLAPAAGRSAGGLTDVEAASATGGRTTSERAGASLGWERGAGITTGGVTTRGPSAAGRLRNMPAMRRASERLGGDSAEAGVVTGWVAAGRPGAAAAGAAGAWARRAARSMRGRAAGAGRAVSAGRRESRCGPDAGTGAADGGGPDAVVGDGDAAGVSLDAMGGDGGAGGLGPPGGVAELTGVAGPELAEDAAGGGALREAPASAERWRLVSEADDGDGADTGAGAAGGAGVDGGADAVAAGGAGGADGPDAGGCGARGLAAGPAVAGGVAAGGVAAGAGMAVSGRAEAGRVSEATEAAGPLSADGAAGTGGAAGTEGSAGEGVVALWLEGGPAVGVRGAGDSGVGVTVGPRSALGVGAGVEGAAGDPVADAVCGLGATDGAAAVPDGTGAAAEAGEEFAGAAGGVGVAGGRVLKRLPARPGGRGRGGPGASLPRGPSRICAPRGLG